MHSKYFNDLTTQFENKCESTGYERDSMSSSEEVTHDPLPLWWSHGQGIDQRSWNEFWYNHGCCEGMCSPLNEGLKL
jgi:hypothetical protein